MQANQQGTFYKSLQITRNNESFSNTILKTEFLKKVGNYTCVVQDFVTNITPPLNDSSEVSFQINVKGNAGTAVAAATFPAYWRAVDYQFTPKPYHSTIEFLRQAQQFFHKFNFLARVIGASGVGGHLDAADRANGYPFLKTIFTYNEDAGEYSEAGWQSLENATANTHGEEERRIVSCKMKSDGVFQVDVSPDFANNFYITVGTETQRLLGLNPLLDPLGDALIDDTGLAPVFAVHAAILVPQEYESRNALHQLDERLSLDIVATFPLSNKKFAFDGKEQNEYILARFPINDYNKFDTTLESTPERATMNVIVREQVNVGLEDLTRKSPSSSGIYLLPGTIQEVNIQLWTRYFSDGKIKHIKTNMSEGFWTLKLLFGKKV